MALVPGKFEVAGVKQVPIIDLGIYREVGLIWQRERKRDALKEFIDFAACERAIGNGSPKIETALSTQFTI